ncbi:unnamed protein product, partial [Bubo scandiacus]
EAPPHLGLPCRTPWCTLVGEVGGNLSPIKLGDSVLSQKDGQQTLGSGGELHSEVFLPLSGHVLPSKPPKPTQKPGWRFLLQSPAWLWLCVQCHTDHGISALHSHTIISSVYTSLETQLVPEFPDTKSFLGPVPSTLKRPSTSGSSDTTHLFHRMKERARGAISPLCYSPISITQPMPQQRGSARHHPHPTLQLQPGLARFLQMLTYTHDSTCMRNPTETNSGKNKKSKRKIKKKKKSRILGKLNFNKLISRMNKSDMRMLLQPPCLIPPGKNIICPIVDCSTLPPQYPSHQHVINHPSPAGTSQELKTFYKP